MKSTFVISFFVLLVAVQQGNSLECWLCTSDSAQYCDDPFNQDNRAPGYAKVTCDPNTVNQNGGGYLQPSLRPVCQKQVRMVRDKRVVTRRCVFDSRPERTHECQKESSASYITTEFCQNCDTDGCNAATGVYASATTLGAIFLSAMFAKLFA